MIKGEDIIIVGQQAWDVEIGSNCKNIALEFSKYNRVLYINSPLDRITKIRHSEDRKIKKRINVIKGKENGLVKVNENLWTYYPDKIIESINWIRYHKLFLFFNKRNNKIFASSIIKVIQTLDFNSYILFNDSDMFRSFYLKELIKPKLTIYYSRDNMIVTDYYKRHGKYLEPQLIEKSDLCVANSEYLKNYCKTFNQNSYYVGQGCELELFQKPESLNIPEEFNSINAPIIGYVGALTSSRLDIDLIEFLARNAPEYNFVLVGPEDENFKRSKLHVLENVFFLGSKKTEELPKYINAFDVCMNPQVLNGLTIGNYPRKIDEYLAMGKPVVATKTETMETFKEFVFLAANKEEFLYHIEQSLIDNSYQIQEERKEFAFSHSWQNSVDQIFKGVIKVIGEKEKGKVEI